MKVLIKEEEHAIMSAFKIEGDNEIEKRKTLVDRLLKEYFILLRRHSLSPEDEQER